MKGAVTFLAFVKLAAIRLWPRVHEATTWLGRQLMEPRARIQLFPWTRLQAVSGQLLDQQAPKPAELLARLFPVSLIANMVRRSCIRRELD